MTHIVRRTFLALGVAALAVAALTSPALAKGPRILMVYGSPLAKPIIVNNWANNEKLMFAITDDMSVQHAHLRGRPYFRLALFWRETWDQYMKHHKPSTALHPNQADQFARFYPAYGASRPLFVLDSIPGPYTSLVRRIRPAGLAVLRRYGVPVRLPLGTLSANG